MTNDPFLPPASPLEASTPGAGAQLLVFLAFAVPAYPCATMLYVLVALRDICAPTNPAMDGLYVVFSVFGPLWAGLVGVFGLSSRAVRERWYTRLALGGFAAASTVLVLAGAADVGRAAATGANLAQLVEALRAGLVGSVMIAAMSAVGVGWLPALAIEPVVRRLRR